MTTRTLASLPSALPRCVIAAPLCILLAAASCGQYSYSGQGEGTYAWGHGPRKVTVKALGEIEFAPDDSDVTRLSSDGYLMIEESLAWDNKIVEFSPGPQGQVQKRLLVDGKQQPLDVQSLSWVRRLLPEVIRHTGLGAEARAQRFLESGGYAGFVTEVERIWSDEVRSRYVVEAFEGDHLDAAERADLLRNLGRLVRSDSRRVSLLRQWSAHTQQEPLRAAFFDAVDRIGSDSNKTRLLREMLTTSDGNPEFLLRLLSSAGRIGSDSNRAHLLREAAVRLPADSPTHEAFLEAAGGIGSDSNKASVLLALLPRAVNDHPLLERLLHAARTIGSDTNKARLLVSTAPYADSSAAVAAAFFETAETIGSSSNRQQALAAVLDGPNVSARTLARLYAAGTSIGSDNNKSALLIRSVPSYRENAEVRKAFFAMAGAIRSTSGRANVFLSLLELPELAPETVLALLESTESIGADRNKAEVLARVAQRHDTDPRVQALLERVAKTIGSDNAYRRVMSEIGRDADQARRGEG